MEKYLEKVRLEAFAAIDRGGREGILIDNR